MGMGICGYDSSTWEVRRGWGESGVEGQLWRLREFEANLRYMNPCLKKKKKKGTEGFEQEQCEIQQKR